MEETEKNMEMGRMRYKWVSGAISLMLGLLPLFGKVTTVASYVRAAGIALVICAAAYVVVFFLAKPRRARTFGLLISGAVMAIFGIFFLTNPDAGYKFFPLIMGVAVLFSACFDLLGVLSMRYMQNISWKTSALFALIAAVMGVLILLHPGYPGRWFAVLTGGALLINGISGLSQAAAHSEYKS
ncbi:MAG: HdeD family acid-resistance protein [Anaerovoracaceae bacterium]|jgi:uncharacterized membrane protein HdeD (DUF308 family)